MRRIPLRRALLLLLLAPRLLLPRLSWRSLQRLPLCMGLQQI